MTTRNTPIFCDNCSSLALAEINNQYLCAACLFKELDVSEQHLSGGTVIKPVAALEKVASESMSMDSIRNSYFPQDTDNNSSV